MNELQIREKTEGTATRSLRRHVSNRQKSRLAIVFIVAIAAMLIVPVFRNELLISSCSSGNVFAVRMLLQSGADANYQHVSRTIYVPWLERFTGALYSFQGVQIRPLYAITHSTVTAKDKIVIINALVSAGADINVTNDRGTSVLGASIGSEKPIEVVKLLIESGADVNLSGLGTPPPIVLAEQERRHDMVNLLRHYGAKEHHKGELFTRF